MSDDHTVCIVASQDDGIYYNFRTKYYLDLDNEYQISNIKEIIHDHENRKARIESSISSLALLYSPTQQVLRISNFLSFCVKFRIFNSRKAWTVHHKE